ncbi:MAG TPA: glycosyltransferase family 4 protein, partial [Candidatus Binatia bacterium]
LRVDCLHIIHSKAAYEVAGTLKRVAPWVSITDRNEVIDPGGKFPLISAKVGGGAIDVRTVGHQKLADYMYETYQLTPGSLRLIYAGTDTKRADKALANKHGRLQKMCGLPSDTPVVIFVGRMTYQKRPEVFVRSVARIFEVQPRCSAHFVMVGDGELTASVEALILSHGLQSRIHLLGAHADAMELIADATLLMMPSAYEGLALVSYEAMAVGVPQIFADVNGQSELITADTGILIAPGPDEENRYAAACLELLSDPARRERMSRTGKERIRADFSVEKAVARYADIFEDCAALARKRRLSIPSLDPPHLNSLYTLDE